MTIRALIRSSVLHGALLAAVVMLPFAVAHAQAKAGGQRAFWCKSPNGVAAMQLESCAPGTEVHSEAVGPHGTVAPRPVQSGVVTNAPAAAAAEPSRPAAAQRTSPAADTPVAAPATKPRGYGLKEGLFSILKLLGLALLLGLIGRQLGRSFWRWAIAGCVLWAALVLLKVMKF